MLDDFNLPTFGVSLRKIKSDYTGKVLKVRRSSNNDETDISFFNNEINVDELLGFVGEGDGFITVWYDQYQNNNAIQTTTNLQPIIVSGGTFLNTVKFFDNSSLEMGPYLTIDTPYSASTPIVSTIYVSRININGNYPYLISANSFDYGGLLSLFNTTTGRWRFGSKRTNGSFIYNLTNADTLGEYYIKYIELNRSKVLGYVNDVKYVDENDSDADFLLPTNVDLGSGRSIGRIYDTDIMEMVFFINCPNKHQILLTENVNNNYKLF